MLVTIENFFYSYSIILVELATRMDPFSVSFAYYLISNQPTLSSVKYTCLGCMKLVANSISFTRQHCMPQLFLRGH